MWPHTIVAAVYAPISSAKRLVCLDEAATPEQLRWGRSWRSWLGLAGGRCQYAGWSLDKLRGEVREVQRRAQETGGWRWRRLAPPVCRPMHRLPLAAGLERCNSLPALPQPAPA